VAPFYSLLDLGVIFRVVQNIPNCLSQLMLALLTSDAMKIKLNPVLYHYWVYFDFHGIRR
jgi:hypothetical protein